MTYVLSRIGWMWTLSQLENGKAKEEWNDEDLLKLLNIIYIRETSTESLVQFTYSNGSHLPTVKSFCKE